MAATHYGRTGFAGRRRASRSSLAIVVAMHGAAIAAVLLAQPGLIDRAWTEPIDIIPIEPVDEAVPPPPNEPETVAPPSDVTVTPLPPTAFDNPPPPRPRDLVIDWTPPRFPPPPAQPPAPPAPREPVMIAARMTTPPSALQPAYPSALLRAGTEGRVTVRVRIGTDGRVSEVQLVSATHDGFFEATRRHALRSWRFAPATRDGAPIESWREQTVVFRVANA